MNEMQVHAENKCRNIMTPVSNFSPQMQHWYNNVHTYLALPCLRGSHRKYSNPSNTYQVARNFNIEDPKKLTEEELKDALGYYRIRQKEALGYYRIRQKEVRKQATGLRRVHLCDCLIDDRAKNQAERGRGIKQKIDREHNVRMW